VRVISFIGTTVGHLGIPFDLFGIKEHVSLGSCSKKEIGFRSVRVAGWCRVYSEGI
jgi:hypothetical protein